MLESLLQDLRYSLRSLARSPGFTAVALVTLALGIGATTTMFSVVERLILHPLPFPHADRLVMVWMNDPATGVGLAPSFKAAARWRSSTVVDAVALEESETWYYQGPGGNRFLDGSDITPTVFSTLGLTPVLGRLLVSSDTDADAPRVAVLKEAFWRQEFGGRRDILGTTITLDTFPYTIVGVIPDAVTAIDGWRPQEVWTAFRGDSLTHPITIARVAAGVPEDRAEHELNLLAKQANTSDTSAFYRRLTVVFHHPGMVRGSARQAIVILAGAVGLLLLITCANVASLLLARASHREREVAVRKALGATRRRLLQQPLIESLVLGVLGTGGGLWIAQWAMGVIAGFHPPFIYQLEHLAVDRWVLWFSAAVAVGTSVLSGTLPALHSADLDPAEGLKTSRAARPLRWQARLVTTEMALTTTLLLAGGLLVRSLMLETHADPAFRPQGLAAIEIRFPEARKGSTAARLAFWREMEERSRRLPGVLDAVPIEDPLPYPTFVLGSHLDVEGKTLSEAAQQSTIALAGVTPRSMEVLGIPVLEGRAFTAQEHQTEDSVVIINRGMATRFWPGESALGKRFRYASRGSYVTVVGVIRDDPSIWNDRPGAFQVRFPLRDLHDMRWGGWLAVRMNSSASETAVLGELRAIARSVDPRIVVSTLSGVPALLSARLGSARFTTTLLGTFAALALLIAAVGLYGVLAYAVSQRTREIGIRIALGADAGSVVGLVVRQGLLPTGVGLALGTVGGIALSRFFKALLYNTHGADPVTLAAVVAVLTLAAVASSVVPARRAVRVDPIVALRSE